MKHALLLPAALFLLHSCGNVTSSTAQGGPDLVDNVLAGDLVDENAFVSKDPGRISVPILYAPDLEAKYGRPSYSVMKDGSYFAHYDLGGGHYFDIIGTSRSAKASGHRPNGTVSIMGKSTGFFYTGNEDPEITTQPVKLRTPNGREATYIFRHGEIALKHKVKSLTELPRLSW